MNYNLVKKTLISTNDKEYNNIIELFYSIFKINQVLIMNRCLHKCLILLGYAFPVVVIGAYIEFQHQNALGIFIAIFAMFILAFFASFIQSYK